MAMLEVLPSVSSYVYADSAITFHPDTPRQLECAAYEPSGELLIWNGDLQVTEVAPYQQPLLAALIMKGRYTTEHTAALQRAMLLASGDDALRLSELLQHVTMALADVESEDSRRELIDPFVDTDR
jgi:hypothetical protein